MRSLLWLDKRELDIAPGDAKDAVRLAPNDPRAYSGRGRIRFARREYDKAIADFNEAIRIEPRSAGNYGLRGEAWYFRRDYSGRSPTPARRYGSILNLRGRVSESRSCLRHSSSSTGPWQITIKRSKLDPRLQPGFPAEADSGSKRKSTITLWRIEQAIRIDPKSALRIYVGIALAEKKHTRRRWPISSWP